MKRILVLGANGKIARIVEKRLLNNSEYQLTLVLRNVKRLSALDKVENVQLIDGDIDDRSLLNKVMLNQDIVYANLNGNMESHAKNIVGAMQSNNVRNLIWITGSGLYHETPDPFGTWVENYVGHESKEDTRRAAKIIEISDLNYTIIRAAYMTDDDEINYELTQKGETFKGTMISRKSMADLVVKIIDQPTDYYRESLGISKPGTDNMLNEIRKIEHDI